MTPESEYELFLSVETSRFYSIPKLENFLNHKAKLIIEKSYSLKKDWMSFSNTSRYLDTIYGANSDRQLTTDRMAIPPSDILLSQ